MRPDWQNSHRNFLIPVLTVCLGIWVYSLNPLALDRLRNATFDQYQRWQPRSYVHQPSVTGIQAPETRAVPSVHIVDIDDESIRRLGQWPWPRTRIAELVAKLEAANAAVIVFDFVFADPDRTSPKVMLALWGATPELATALAPLPDHDEALAKVFAKGKVVLAFSAKNPDDDDEADLKAALPSIRARYVEIGGSPLNYLHPLVNPVTPLPQLESVAHGIGAINFFSASDGVVRKVPLVVRKGKDLLPSLDAETIRVLLGETNYRLNTEPGVGLISVGIGHYELPTTPEGEMWVYYTASEDGSVAQETLEHQRYIPAWKILAEDFSAADIKDSIVLIGTSAQGLLDLRFNPLGQFMPGVEAHAQILEQVLSGIALNRPLWAPWLEFFFMVTGGLLVGCVALVTHVMRSFTVCLFVLALLWLGAWEAFAQGGLLLDPAFPSLVMILSYVLSGIVRHLYSERRQRWVKEAFSRYVSPNLVNHLIGSPHALELGGRRQQCSFVFTDLAGFTSLMESMDPADAVAVLNDYLDGMIKVAFSYQGTLDRIVGDAVAIMFSAPVPQSDHQRRALSCALAMHGFAGQYVEMLKARGITFAKTRIGVHTGEVIVGNFGGSTIFDYRALGDPVNTASRLEGANKYLGTLICVSEDTLSGCHGVHARPAGRLLLKGKSKPLLVFEPLTSESERQYDSEAYKTAYELMRTGQAEALVAFEALSVKYPEDPLVALHTQRLRAGVKDDLIVLTEK